MLNGLTSIPLLTLAQSDLSNFFELFSSSQLCNTWNIPKLHFKDCY